MLYNFIKQDTTVRTAAYVAAHASHMINKMGTLLNFAYGEEVDQKFELEHEPDQAIQEEYIDEETEALNEKGRDDLIIYNEKSKI